MPQAALTPDVVDEVIELDTMELGLTDLDTTLESMNTIMTPFTWYFEQRTPPSVTQ